jgi:ABC-type transport system involved in multi-copper enzyme maturation permease subunit
MTTPFLTLVLTWTVLALIQMFAALPWLATLDPVLFWSRVRRPASWGWFFLLALVAGLALTLFLGSNPEPHTLSFWGRIYAIGLHLQLAADLFVLIFVVLLSLWPQGGAVSLAAFREGIRQPMFWLLAGAAFILMWLSTVLPYFTFGEDLKVVKELCYDVVMLAAGLFGIIAASMSISEEIEGKTAITLMSKPVSRRQFLIGKYVGIFLASMVMTALLGVNLVGVLIFKPYFDNEQVAQPQWIEEVVQDLSPTGETTGFIRGAVTWVADAASAAPGLMIGAGQAMVLLAVAVALATRLPVVANIPVCLFIFYGLGHLAPIMSAVSQGGNPLVKFTADVFSTILPGLEYFDMGPVIVRDTPLPLGEFALYTLNVSLYAVVYTSIALFFGLILFEDRDLA